MSDTAKPEAVKTPLTPRETELAVIALQCLQGSEIKVDYDKLASMASYKNKNTAMTVVSALLKHKLSNATVDNFAVAHSAGSSPAASGPKKQRTPKGTPTSDKNNHNADDNPNNNSNNGDTTTPTITEKPKKKRAPKPKAAKPAAVDPTGDKGVKVTNKAADSAVVPKKRARKDKSETPAAKRVKKEEVDDVKQEEEQEDEEEEEEEKKTLARSEENGVDGGKQKFFAAAVEDAAEG
ncbi:MAG: hypothetical protein Q9177_003041 [Variospora cf. flavescens]